MKEWEIKQLIDKSNHGDKIKLVVEHREKETAIYGRVSVDSEGKQKYFVFETDYKGNELVGDGMVNHYSLDYLNIMAYETLVKAKECKWH